MKPIFVGLLRGVANERIDPLVTLAFSMGKITVYNGYDNYEYVKMEDGYHEVFKGEEEPTPSFDMFTVVEEQGE